MSSRLIIAANRGPVSFVARDDGTLAPEFDSSSAQLRLVSQSSPSQGEEAETQHGFNPFDEALPVTWISIAASAGDREAARRSDGEAITSGLPDGHAARLLTPSRRSLHRYYNTICNPLLWFLHHRSWGFTHTPSIDHEAHTAWEHGMVTVSRAFADEIAAEAHLTSDAPLIWLRDYHMHLVPTMVRELVPDARIRYSPAVPWPGPADWLMLPASWRSAIFHSVAATDEVVLTSHSDARALAACLKEFSLHETERPLPKITVSPEVPETAAVTSIIRSRRARSFIDRFERDDRYTFVTAERAEPHRNIVRSIRAFGRALETLLAKDNSLAAEIRFLLVLAPPPPHLSQYRRYMGEIERAARDVNDRHGSGRGKPVELIVENNYHMAVAAMAAADTLVAVPLADAACTTVHSAIAVNEHDCTFLVSETSSIAESLGDGAFKVSPADIEAMAKAMIESLELSDEERARRFDSATQR